MKKIIQLGIGALLIVGLSVSASAQKIGYVNSLQILSEMPEYKQAQANIEALQQQIQKKGEQMVKDLEADYVEVSQKAQAGELSPKQQETESQRLQGEQQKIADFERESADQLQKKQTELLNPLTEKLNGAIEAVAKEGGYVMVLDRQVILYGEATEDLTTQVKAKLGLQ